MEKKNGLLMGKLKRIKSLGSNASGDQTRIAHEGSLSGCSIGFLGMQPLWHAPFGFFVSNCVIKHDFV